MSKSKKASLQDYIGTVQKIKPSAEVTFTAIQPDGSTEEVSSRQVFWEGITSPEVAEVTETVKKETGKLTKRIAELAENYPASPPSQQKSAKKTPVAKESTASSPSVAEDNTPSLGRHRREDIPESTIDGLDSQPKEQFGPVADQFDQDIKSQVPISAVTAIITALDKLCTKLDEMQNFTPIIQVPAPVIHVTLPETRRTVTKAIERDDNNLIKTVKESIEEKPVGSPIIETIAIEDEEVEEDDC